MPCSTRSGCTTPSWRPCARKRSSTTGERATSPRFPLHLDAVAQGRVGYNSPFMRWVIARVGQSPAILNRFGALQLREIDPDQLIPMARMLRFMAAALLRGRFDVLAGFLETGRGMAERPEGARRPQGTLLHERPAEARVRPLRAAERRKTETRRSSRARSLERPDSYPSALMMSGGACTSSISTPSPTSGVSSLPLGWMKQTS